MARKPTKAVLTNMLAAAVTARETNANFPSASTEDANHLIEHPHGKLIETQADPNDATKVRFRATEKGVEVHNAGTLHNAPAAAPAAPPAATPWGASTGAPPPVNPSTQPMPQQPPKVFTFDSGIPLPPPRMGFGGGRGSNTYGFDQMSVGQSFFIASTMDNPNPAKRVASSVTGANKRMKPKTFIVRSVDETAQGRGKGARVWRTA